MTTQTIPQGWTLTTLGEVGMEDRTHRAFTQEDITKLAGTYHEWRSKDGQYEDIKGFCKSAGMEEIKKHNYVLTPGRYVGIKDEEDDGVPFDEKMAGFLGELREQMAEEKRLNKEIEKQLSNISFDL